MKSVLMFLSLGSLLVVSACVVRPNHGPVAVSVRPAPVVVRHSYVPRHCWRGRFGRLHCR